MYLLRAMNITVESIIHEQQKSKIIIIKLIFDLNIINDSETMTTIENNQNNSNLKLDENAKTNLIKIYKFLIRQNIALPEI